MVNLLKINLPLISYLLFSFPDESSVNRDVSADTKPPFNTCSHAPRGEIISRSVFWNDKHLNHSDRTD